MQAGDFRRLRLPFNRMLDFKRSLSESHFARLLRRRNGLRARDAANHFVAQIGSQFEAEQKSERACEQQLWQIWLQGSEYVPPLAQYCADSLDKNLSGATIRRLNLREALELVDVKPKIFACWKDGKLGNAGLTDLLRLGILSKFGGTWSDYTMYLARPTHVDELPHFLLYEGFIWDHPSGWFAPNYFFRNDPGDDLMRLSFMSLSLQWETIGQIDYFDAFWHFAASARFLGPKVLMNRVTGSPQGTEALMNFLHKQDLQASLKALGSQPLHKLSLKTPLESSVFTEWLSSQDSSKL